MNEFQKLLIALWNTMQGETVTRNVFSEMSEQCDDKAYQEFKNLYDNPKTNIVLLWPLAFADMPVADFWHKVQKDRDLPELIKDFLYGEHCCYTIGVWTEETVFEAMITAQNIGCKTLIDFCQSVYYSESPNNEEELMTQLLNDLNKRPYSICVHLAFLVILLKLEFINQENYELLKTAYERHKAGLEARGKDWKKKRCRKK